MKFGKDQIVKYIGDDSFEVTFKIISADKALSGYYSVLVLTSDRKILNYTEKLTIESANLAYLEYKIGDIVFNDNFTMRVDAISGYKFAGTVIKEGLNDWKVGKRITDVNTLDLRYFQLYTGDKKPLFKRGDIVSFISDDIIKLVLVTGEPKDGLFTGVVVKSTVSRDPVGLYSLIWEVDKFELANADIQIKLKR